MRLINRIVIIPAVVAACGMATGCFSYHKTVDATTPAPVVETAPPVVETTPAVVVPPANQLDDHHHDRLQRNCGAAEDLNLHRAVLARTSQIPARTRAWLSLRITRACDPSPWRSKCYEEMRLFPL